MTKRTSKHGCALVVLGFWLTTCCVGVTIVSSLLSVYAPAIATVQKVSTARAQEQLDTCFYVGISLAIPGLIALLTGCIVREFFIKLLTFFSCICLVADIVIVAILCYVYASWKPVYDAYTRHGCHSDGTNCACVNHALAESFFFHDIHCDVIYKISIVVLVLLACTSIFAILCLLMFVVLRSALQALKKGNSEMRKVSTEGQTLLMNEQDDQELEVARPAPLNTEENIAAATQTLVCNNECALDHLHTIASALVHTRSDRQDDRQDLLDAIGSLHRRQEELFDLVNHHQQPSYPAEFSPPPPYNEEYRDEPGAPPMKSWPI